MGPSSVLVVVMLGTGISALPQNANSKSLGGGSGQTSNNIDFTEERDAEDLRYKQVIQAKTAAVVLSFPLKDCRCSLLPYVKPQLWCPSLLINN